MYVSNSTAFELSDLYEENFAVGFGWVQLLYLPQKYFHYQFPRRLLLIALYYFRCWYIKCTNV